MNKGIFKNASWIICCRIFQAVINLIISMIVARYLGPSNYGVISYAASITAFIVPLVQLGLRNTVVQEIVLDTENEGETVGTVIGMTVTSSFLGIIGIISFVSIVNRDDTDTIIVCALYSISLIFQMTEMMQYWFQAKLLSKYVAIVSLIAYVIVSVYKVYLLITRKSIYWFAVTGSFDYLLISIALFIIYKQIGNGKLRFSWNRAKALLTRSKYYIVSGMMITIFAQTDRIMLTNMIGNEINGYYSAAVTCAGMTGFVFAAIIDSYRPVIFENKNKDESLYKKYLINLYTIIIYLGLLQSVFVLFFAPIIIHILYGAAYMQAVPILRIITWYSAFSYMGSVRNIWILAEEKQNVIWIINLSGAVLNVFLNLILIPMFGAVGAAVATVVTQFFTNFILCFIIRSIRYNASIIIDSIKGKELIQLLSVIKKKTRFLGRGKNAK